MSDPDETAAIAIRRCRLEDWHDIFQLLRQLWPGRQLEPDAMYRVFRSGHDSASQVYFAACTGERIVGFGSLHIKSSLWQMGALAHVDELVVDSDDRGRGIGTQLLLALIGESRKRGCLAIELDSAHHRSRSHQFYEQHGFTDRARVFSKSL